MRALPLAGFRLAGSSQLLQHTQNQVTPKSSRRCCVAAGSRVGLPAPSQAPGEAGKMLGLGGITPEGLHPQQSRGKGGEPRILSRRFSRLADIPKFPELKGQEEVNGPKSSLSSRILSPPSPWGCQEGEAVPGDGPDPDFGVTSVP